MRLIVNGQQAFGAAVLDALLERGEEVVAAYCAPEAPGEPIDPLRQAAQDAAVPVHQPESFKDPATARELAELGADLMVMAFVTLFVPPPVLDTPTYGTIQYHPSLLPRHRGPSAINWSIIQGDRTTGITIFWPDEGLDTGPLLLLKEVDVDDDDTLGSLYFDKLFPLGVEAMIEAVELIRAGQAPRIAQAEDLASYESWCRKEDVEIDWRAPGRQVYDLIRGADPRPGAWTAVGGEPLEILAARWRSGASAGAPGEVVEVSEQGFSVALDGGVLGVGQVRAAGEKLDAAHYARTVGLRAGVALGAA